MSGPVKKNYQSRLKKLQEKAERLQKAYIKVRLEEMTIYDLYHRRVKQRRDKRVIKIKIREMETELENDVHNIREMIIRDEPNKKRFEDNEEKIEPDREKCSESERIEIQERHESSDKELECFLRNNKVSNKELECLQKGIEKINKDLKYLRKKRQDSKKELKSLQTRNERKDEEAECLQQQCDRINKVIKWQREEFESREKVSECESNTYQHFQEDQTNQQSTTLANDQNKSTCKQTARHNESEKRETLSNCRARRHYGHAYGSYNEFLQYSRFTSYREYLESVCETEKFFKWSKNRQKAYWRETKLKERLNRK